MAAPRHIHGAAAVTPTIMAPRHIHGIHGAVAVTPTITAPLLHIKQIHHGTATVKRTPKAAPRTIHHGTVTTPLQNGAAAVIPMIMATPRHIHHGAAVVTLTIMEATPPRHIRGPTHTHELSNENR